MKRRGEGLHNSVAFLMRQRPGLTAEQAWREVQANILVETQRNVEMRPLQAISGSLGATTPSNDDDDDDADE
ncbi:MAG: hypothetical protein M4D80_37680 [Myxococcota bacterium]|nr:hypothetical protein [Deltaproteobacteria bacterium]MDQ3340924.1 hypothetical protein [Myxococcota bacterium]